MNFGFPGAWLLPLAIIVGLLLMSEFIELLRNGTPGINAWVAYAGTLCTILAVALPEILRLPADCPVGRWGVEWLGIGVYARRRFRRRAVGF